jgi:hypothetical protein
MYHYRAREEAKTLERKIAHLERKKNEYAMTMQIKDKEHNAALQRQSAQSIILQNTQNERDLLRAQLTRAEAARSRLEAECLALRDQNTALKRANDSLTSDNAQWSKLWNGPYVCSL